MTLRMRKLLSTPLLRNVPFIRAELRRAAARRIAGRTLMALGALIAINQVPDLIRYAKIELM